MNSLVAYFSAESGKTRNIAIALAEQTHSAKFEIVPEKPYTEADLKWTNPLTFVKPDELADVLGLIPGAVSPFGLFNDT